MDTQVDTRLGTQLTNSPETRCGSDLRKGEVTVADGDVPLFETDRSAR